VRSAIVFENLRLSTVSVRPACSADATQTQSAGRQFDSCARIASGLQPDTAQRGEAAYSATDEHGCTRIERARLHPC
jgi:hypothetical protein